MAEKCEFNNEKGINTFIHIVHLSNQQFPCRVFSSDTEGRDCGDDVSNWLNRYFATDKIYRLVHFEPHLMARQPQEGFPKDEKV